MSVTLTKDPFHVALSRNKMCFHLQSTFENPAPFGRGAYATYITEENFLNVNDTILITWTEPDGTTTSAIFFAVTTPVLTNTIQAGNPGALTFPEYLQEIADKIQAHPIISLFFTVYVIVGSGGLHTLVIEVSDPVPDWTVIISIDGLTIPGVSVESFPYSASQVPEGYKVFLDVFFEEQYLSGDFSVVASLSQFLDSEGKTSFNLQDILHSELMRSYSEPPIPPFGNETPINANNLRRYFIRYSEDYESFTKTWTYEDVKLVMCGGVSQDRFADCDFFANLSATNSFLTWYPGGKKLSMDQPDYLSWINYTTGSKSVRLKIQAWRDDNTLDFVQYIDWGVFGEFTRADAWETIVLPVGYGQLEIMNLESSPGIVVKYGITVVDYDNPGPGEELSQERIFWVDCFYYECKKFILYLNGFCLPETLLLTGQTKKQLTIDRQTSALTLTCDYSHINGQFFQYAQDFENIFTYRTGYKSRIEIEALQEMLIENQAYEIFQSGYVPLFITDKKFDITECLQFLHALQFKAVRSLKRINYSNSLIPCDGALPICGPSNWQSPEDECWNTPNGLNWEGP